jgi:hypothetical protein
MKRGSSLDGHPFTGQPATATLRFALSFPPPLPPSFIHPRRHRSTTGRRTTLLLTRPAPHTTLQIVRLLLDEADRTGAGDIPLVSMADEDGDTALHIAVSWGQSEVVDLLHGRGGNLAGKNFSGLTPLDLAAPGKSRHHLVTCMPICSYPRPPPSSPQLRMQVRFVSFCQQQSHGFVWNRTAAFD